MSDAHEITPEMRSMRGDEIYIVHQLDYDEWGNVTGSHIDGVTYYRKLAESIADETGGKLTMVNLRYPWDSDKRC